MSKQATLQLPSGKSIELPVVEGTESDRAVDISRLRASTGFTTFDPGFGNTAGFKSEITYLDGEKGILRYRGIPIQQLAENADFLEVSYLLLYGSLPSKATLQEFSSQIEKSNFLPEDIYNFVQNSPSAAHPVANLASATVSLSAHYAKVSGEAAVEKFGSNVIQMLAKIRVLAAYAYRKSVGQPLLPPEEGQSYCGNFLKMMFAAPGQDYQVQPVVEKALNLLLILHADHEQNCSTSTVRTVGSGMANFYASIAAGILALWGPLHGGANQQVIEMLQRIREEGGDIKRFIEMAKDKSNPFRLMGFGHRVYKNYDPRAAIVKKSCDSVLEQLGVNDPLLDIAKELEHVALNDSYFQDRKLYPNVDFYSGVIYRAVGIPTNMLTVMFALGRLPGWAAQWYELMNDPEKRIIRPRQIYTGEQERGYVADDLR